MSSIPNRSFYLVQSPSRNMPFWPLSASSTLLLPPPPPSFSFLLLPSPPPSSLLLLDVAFMSFDVICHKICYWHLQVSTCYSHANGEWQATAVRYRDDFRSSRKHQPTICIFVGLLPSVFAFISFLWGMTLRQTMYKMRLQRRIRTPPWRCLNSLVTLRIHISLSLRTSLPLLRFL